MLTTTNDLFIFIVDTDSYSGNFERALTAFCTGCIGDCGMGDRYAKRFKEECPDMVRPMEGIVATIPDDSGCYRPTTIWITPGYWNDGLGGHWTDAEWGSEKAIEGYRSTVRRRQEEDKGFGGPINEMDPKTVLPKRYPAYQSVAMFFCRRPPEDMLEFLRQRVLQYKPLQEFDGTFKALGFRLIQTETVEKVLWTAQNGS